MVVIVTYEQMIVVNSYGDTVRVDLSPAFEKALRGLLEELGAIDRPGGLLVYVD